MPKLSLVIITYNEESNIQRCIESAQGLVDEIVVVDSGSSDKTVEISKSLGAKVIHQDFLGYIEQKNFATAQATFDWVLSLDADEALSSDLKHSIAEAIINPGVHGFTMNRLTQYVGNWVKHGGWYPDKKLRLYQRQHGQWTGLNPHDRYELNNSATTQHLKGDILHYSYATLSDHLKQIDRFSAIGAQALKDAGGRSSILKIIYKPFARFCRIYFIKSGWLDGLTGFAIAVSGAYYVFLKYFRCYYLQNSKKA